MNLLAFKSSDYVNGSYLLKDDVKVKWSHSITTLWKIIYITETNLMLGVLRAWKPLLSGTQGSAGLQGNIDRSFWCFKIKKEF